MPQLLSFAPLRNKALSKCRCAAPSSAMLRTLASRCRAACSLAALRPRLLLVRRRSRLWPRTSATTHATQHGMPGPPEPGGWPHARSKMHDRFLTQGVELQSDGSPTLKVRTLETHTHTTFEPFHARSSSPALRQPIRQAPGLCRLSVHLPCLWGLSCSSTLVTAVVQSPACIPDPQLLSLLLFSRQRAIQITKP